MFKNVIITLLSHIPQTLQLKGDDDEIQSKNFLD